MGKVLNKYEIKIHGLTDGEHEFEFEMSKPFFQAFEQDLIEEGNFRAKVLMNKSASMLQLDFHITGNVRLTCDRSLDEFDYEVDTREPYLFKFGADRNVVADDVEIIPFGTLAINIAQHLFDFIALAIPVKKLHPRYEDEDEAEDFIYSVGDDDATDSEGPENEETDNVDPRWAALAALKKQQNDN